MRPARSSARRADRIVSIVLGATLLGLAGSAPATTPRIVNGTDTHASPTTGLLLIGGSTGINSDNAQAWCSGTLIGCQTFLTAAHCVEDYPQPSRYWVYLQHGGIYPVSSISAHGSYDFPIADVAVLGLEAQVTGIDPMTVNTTNPAPFIPHSGTIVGFGQTQGGAGDYGIKRIGLVETSNCSQSTDGGTNTELVCWDFENPVGAPGEDSNTCNGDSGGPLYMNLGAGTVVAGITSGGTNSSCLASDDSYDVNVANYSPFILGELGSDPTTTCGGLPPVGDALVQVTGNTGELDTVNDADSFSVTVPNGASVLRFGFNGEDNGSFDADFYVKQGPGAGSTSYDCKDDGASVFGACEFLLPASGEWSVAVEQWSGSGQYQVTTTVFGGDPPECGNDLKEFGEDCDGTDAGNCPTGVCEPDCTCPAPVCGNDFTESGEECDGTDAGACPTGLCEPDCTCPAPICGNDLTEPGEDCDGSDDTACPGQCEESCACPVPCQEEAFYRIRAKSTDRVFIFKSVLDNFGGAFNDLDPRNEFTFVLTQDPAAVTVTIPAQHPGWSANESRGKYVWRGELAGASVVKLVDRSDKSLGGWKLVVKGRGIDGAADIDVWDFFDVHLTIDGVCNENLHI